MPRDGPAEDPQSCHEGTAMSSKPLPAAPRPREGPFGAPGAKPSPPESGAECLEQIKVLGLRVQEYVLFMCRVGSLTGSSDASKDRAVRAFHERLSVLER